MKRADLGGKLVAAVKKPKKTAKANKGLAPELKIEATGFRRRLMAWYRLNARVLPWRGATDPYHIWVSETMLQQTRVAAVLEHYAEFLRRFPTLVALALASEADVLAAWSGLGYYRRARMLHKAAQFIVLERNGRLPATSAELRSLPGIGDYTAPAIASIAFGESVAVVDGNVERVLLRLTGRPNDATAQGRAFVQRQAQSLVPRKNFAAGRSNAAGDHNQAMMELGATVCLPKAPLCLSCPVYDLCVTRGEHRTPGRTPQRSKTIAYLLHIRKDGPVTERHSITNTNYYVEVFAQQAGAPPQTVLSSEVGLQPQDLHWTRASRLPGLPLTGLARKILQRLDVMDIPNITLLE
jgi:A/G-specific adenine glycosylase